MKGHAWIRPGLIQALSSVGVGSHACKGGGPCHCGGSCKSCGGRTGTARTALRSRSNGGLASGRRIGAGLSTAQKELVRQAGHVIARPDRVVAAVRAGSFLRDVLVPLGGPRLIAAMGGPERPDGGKCCCDPLPTPGGRGNLEHYYIA